MTPVTSFEKQCSFFTYKINCCLVIWYNLEHFCTFLGKRCLASLLLAKPHSLLYRLRQMVPGFGIIDESHQCFNESWRNLPRDPGRFLATTKKFHFRVASHKNMREWLSFVQPWTRCNGWIHKDAFLTDKDFPDVKDQVW